MIATIRTVCFVAALMGVAHQAAAGTITFNFNAPTAGEATGAAIGQSVTTPAGGPWTDITFNLYDHTGTPGAFGTLFLLTEAYSGLASDLTSLTDGFLASTSTVSGGKWVFDASVILQPGTEYWFLMANYAPGGLVLFGTADPYTAGSAYGDFGGGYFAIDRVDMAFLLEGNEISSVPEPATLVLVGAGLALIASRRRRV